MPLFQMDPNIQESESAGRKRSHDEYAGESMEQQNASEPKKPTCDIIAPSDSPLLADEGRVSPADKDPAGPSAGSNRSASPRGAVEAACTLQSTEAPKPAVKRKKLTASEKDAEAAAKKREQEERTAKREADKAARAKEKAIKEAEKVARAREREEKRRVREEADKLKAEKKRKGLEEQKQQEEKRKRAQPKLSSFFKQPQPLALKKKTPEREPTTEYDRRFKAFHLSANTRWTNASVQMDEETRAAKCRVLDEYLNGQRERERTAFDAVELLCLATKPQARGRLHHPVRHIMENAYREAEKSKKGGKPAKNALEQAREKLATVPMKMIAFSQDVRPPYLGTVTFKTFAIGSGNMRRLARNSARRRLPLNYDYDSEAEWQDDEGEDVDVDDDDGEELEDEDDMDGFLDDSDDAGLAKRVFVNSMEPEITGICFEDDLWLVRNQRVHEHRMEFLHAALRPSWGIDPWSGQYWETEQTGKPVKVAAAAEAAVKMAPPPAPCNAFATLGAKTGPAAGAKLVKSELMDDVKRAILNNKALSKVGIIDFIFHQFRDNVSRAEVKNTIELVAEKTGSGRSKEWTLRPGHEVV
ncbi:hypothetical protein RJ55_05440 [Drechmeria coniospora]|nr:hypothetical protein RJ55_05440 [Drechmeria coniospora]